MRSSLRMCHMPTAGEALTREVVWSMPGVSRGCDARPARLFFSGAMVANELQAPPELPVEQSPHPVVNRCGALLLSVNFIEGPTATPRAHGALRFHVVYLKAICDHSRVDEEIWHTVLAVEGEWMSETPNPQESWCMSMGCSFVRNI